MTDIISKLRDRIPMNPEAEWAPVETALLKEAIAELERLWAAAQAMAIASGAIRYVSDEEFDRELADLLVRRRAVYEALAKK